jgi:hypothetical protein
MRRNVGKLLGYDIYLLEGASKLIYFIHQIHRSSAGNSAR